MSDNFKKSNTALSKTAKSLWHAVVFGLTFPFFSILFPITSYACSAHDHGCVYHAFGSQVNTTPQTNTNGTSLVIYAIGTTNTQPSAVDFDNKVLLPEKTGDRILSNSYQISTKPYIVNQTPYGAANPPPDWNSGANDGVRQVYPSQYQVIFNKNTATARHTGDLNGGENGNIPNATGCPNMPGKANCEAVVVTGNVPNGVYEQRVRIFNFQNIPNPQVDIKLGAYATGSGTLISSSHIPAKDGAKELADFISLSGTGAMSDTYKYEFYDRGFDVDRTGVAWFDRSKSRIRKSTPYIAGDHIAQDVYRDTTVTTTTVKGDGSSDFFTRTFHKHVGQDVVGYLEPSVVLPSVVIMQNTTGCTGAGCILSKNAPIMLFANANVGIDEIETQYRFSVNPNGVFFDYANGGGGKPSIKSSIKGVAVDYLVDKVHASHQPNALGNFSKALYDYASYPFNGFVSDVMKNENKIMYLRNNLLINGGELYDAVVRLIDSSHERININIQDFNKSSAQPPGIDFQKGCSAIYGPTDSFGDKMILHINKKLFSCDN